MDEIRKSVADKKVIERCIKELRQNTAEEIKTLKKELFFLKRQFQESSDKKEKTLSWLANMLPEENVTGRVEMEVEQLNLQSLPLPTNNKLISLPAKKGTAEPDACGVHDATVSIFALSGVPYGMIFVIFFIPTGNLITYL